MAQSILSEAVSSNPRDLAIRELLLKTYEKAGQAERAAETAQVIVNLDDSPNNRFRLARWSAQAGDMIRAREGKVIPC